MILYIVHRMQNLGILRKSERDYSMCRQESGRDFVAIRIINKVEFPIITGERAKWIEHPETNK